MKKVVLVMIVIVCSSFMKTDNQFWIAGEEFIKTLKTAAPKIEGETIREYQLQDLNFDNRYEVIEKVNKIEEDLPGILNIEFYPDLNSTESLPIAVENFSETIASLQITLTSEMCFTDS